jgi:hypothetical protein
MDIESRLYHYGLGAGIPYAALNSIANMFDTVRHAPELVRRRGLMGGVLHGPRAEGSERDGDPDGQGLGLAGDFL